MSHKTYIPHNQHQPISQIGATLEALGATIAERRTTEGRSYTHTLLTDDVAIVLGKVTEEAQEVAEAAREDDIDHLRYEVADVVYHLMVVLERYGITLDEMAAELNMRMKDEERPDGGVLLHPEYVQRGK